MDESLQALRASSSLTRGSAVLLQSNPSNGRLAVEVEGAEEEANLSDKRLLNSYLSDQANLLVSSESPSMIPKTATPGEKGQLKNRRQRAVAFVVNHWERIAILLVVLFIIILVVTQGVAVFDDILKWFEKQNNWVGLMYFTVLYCANEAIFLPGFVLVLGAGFVFGVWRGFVAVWIGGCIGQALAFLLARYLVGEWVIALLSAKWKKWSAIDKAIQLEGWKLLLLLRCCPLIPWNILNITMATTHMNFWMFAGASAVGIIPSSVVMVYLGSLADNMAAVASGQAGHFSTRNTWLMALLTIIIIAIVAVWSTILVRRAMRRAENHIRSERNLQELVEAGGDKEPQLRLAQEAYGRPGSFATPFVTPTRSLSGNARSDATRVLSEIVLEGSVQTTTIAADAASSRMSAGNPLLQGDIRHRGARSSLIGSDPSASDADTTKGSMTPDSSKQELPDSVPLLQKGGESKKEKEAED